MGVNMETDEQRAANEREQIEQVFSLTGGELMDVAWVPQYMNGRVSHQYLTPVVFTYWYQDVPEYVERSYSDPIRPGGIYRTVVRNEMFGMVPETVTDDEGTWKVVARYSTSGECECPYQHDDDPPVPTKEHPCPLCAADGSPAWQSPSNTDAGEHGVIYIGEGWAEIVYRLDAMAISPRPCMHNGYHQPGECPEANAS
jgi:hypothetical protein